MGYIVAVVRVSDIRQSTSGYGPEAQLSDIRQYAALHGMQIDETISDSISGTVPIRRRPGGKRLYDLIDRRRVTDIIFARIDRIARDEDGIELLQLRRDVRELGGINLHYADRGRADLTGTGGLIDYIQAVQAGDERKKIVDRTHKGRLAQVEAGSTFVCARPPYGYTRVVTPREANRKRIERLEIDRKEAAIVRKMFNWCAAGLSTSAIATRLTNGGVPTRADTHKGYQVKRFRGWSRSAVGSILRNKSYTGKWQYGKRKVIRPKLAGEHYHFIEQPEHLRRTVEIPAIISPELFEKAQKQLTENRHKTRPAKNTYLLRGLCRCALCGSRLVGRPHETGGAYVCNHAASFYGEERCKSPQFSARQIDGIVWEWCKDLLLNPGRVIEIHDAARQSIEPTSADRAAILEDLDKSIAQARTERLGWQRMLAKGQVDETTFAEEVAAVDAQIARYEDERVRVLREASADANAEVLAKTLTLKMPDIAKVLEQGGEAVKRQLIESLGLRFVVSRTATKYVIEIFGDWFPGSLKIQRERPKWGLKKS